MNGGAGAGDWGLARWQEANTPFGGGKLKDT